MTLTLPPSPQRPCVFQKLTEEHRVQVARWFTNNEVTTARIAAALNAAGYSMGTDVVRRHRFNQCRGCAAAHAETPPPATR